MSSLQVYDPALKNTLALKDILHKSKLELTTLHPSHLNVKDIQKNIGSILDIDKRNIVLKLIQIRKETKKANPHTISSLFRRTRKKEKEDSSARPRENLMRSTFKKNMSAPKFSTTAPKFSTTAPKFSTTAPKFSTTVPKFLMELPVVPSQPIIPDVPTHSIALSYFPPQERGESDNMFLARIKHLLPPTPPTISISRTQLLGESDAFYSLRMDYLNKKEDKKKKIEENTLPSLEKLQRLGLTKAEIIDFYLGIINISRVKEDIVFAGLEYGKALKMKGGRRRVRRPSLRRPSLRRRSRPNKKAPVFRSLLQLDEGIHL